MAVERIEIVLAPAPTVAPNAAAVAVPRPFEKPGREVDPQEFPEHGHLPMLPTTEDKFHGGPGLDRRMRATGAGGTVRDGQVRVVGRPSPDANLG